MTEDIYLRLRIMLIIVSQSLVFILLFQVYALRHHQLRESVLLNFKTTIFSPNFWNLNPHYVPIETRFLLTVYKDLLIFDQRMFLIIFSSSSWYTFKYKHCCNFVPPAKIHNIVVAWTLTWPWAFIMTS